MFSFPKIRDFSHSRSKTFRTLKNIASLCLIHFTKIMLTNCNKSKAFVSKKVPKLYNGIKKTHSFSSLIPDLIEGNIVEVVELYEQLFFM